MIHRAQLEISLRDDPMRAARDLVAFVRNGEDTIRKQHYANVSLIYLFAQGIQADDQQMKLFLADEFWKDPRNAKYKLKGKNILRLSMRYHYEAGREGPLYERCREYANALQPFFEEGVEYKDLPERLQNEGGFEGRLLAQRVTKWRASNAPEEEEDDDEETSDPQNVDGSDDESPGDGKDDDFVLGQNHGGGRDAQNVRSPKPEGRPTFRMGLHLLIEADEKIQQEVFAENAPSRILVELKIAKGPSKFVPLIATGIRRFE